MKLGSRPEADNLGPSAKSVSNDGATPDGLYTLDGTILCFVLAFQVWWYTPINRELRRNQLERREFKAEMPGYRRL
jgi:hypothetical protein